MMSLSTCCMAPLAGISIASSSLFASPLVFEASGTIEMFSSSFGGADQYPFLGATDNDLVRFHFEFDTDAMPDSVDGDWYRYEFDGSSSYIDLGPNRAYFETIILSTGTTNSGSGGVSFTGINDTLGFQAFAGLFGAAPMTGSIPDSLSFDDFNSSTFDANSSQNQFLLPIAFGVLDSASITPTPSTMAPLFCGMMIMGRRRR